MKQSKIQEWLTYWQNARMVDLDEIRAFEHVHQARRFCSCMRVGVFATVADLDIWRALENMRDGAKYPELNEMGVVAPAPKYPKQNMTQAEQAAIRSLAT